MATIYDVARAAGVSPASVSRVLNRPTTVSEALRQKVLAAIDELDFSPRAEAVARARLGIKTIAVVAPFSSHAAASRRVAGIVSAAQRENVEVLLYDHPSATISGDAVLSTIPVRGRVDGVVVVSLPLDAPTAARLLARHLPTVLLDTSHPQFPSISTDDEVGGRLAAEHFLEMGHTFLGFLGESTVQATSPSSRRWRGFSSAFESKGIDVQAQVLRVDSGPDDAARVAVSMLTRPEAPTAIFASDDDRAAAVLQAAATLGIEVPRELAVIGFDDSPVARILGLGTVRQPLEQSGEFAARMLLRLLENKPIPQIPTLRVELISRRSSGASRHAVQGDRADSRDDERPERQETLMFGMRECRRCLDTSAMSSMSRHSCRRCPENRPR
ncbi:LacI family DNA-binding transcriptional regulator [Agromyces silvae]|uniref:LacI family DNA-binding transcriptional regulator n=1 Tax=Agromyces silvae TaxID=3388266 RepID=UPI00280A679F|nr:LacI family DNA-binding transcriptional regulator [Agromyces protaetiae]